MLQVHGVDTMKMVFKGPDVYFFAIPGFFFIFVFISIVDLFLINPFDLWGPYAYPLSSFLYSELFVALFMFIVWCIQYFVGKKGGVYENDAILLIFNNDKIQSIIDTYGKKRHRIVYSNNIEKMKYNRYLGATRHKIKIWPKNYDILAESGFEFGEGVLEYYKKHGTPVILYPPAVSRKERKRLKNAIEEFKKENGIE